MPSIGALGIAGLAQGIRDYHEEHQKIRLADEVISQLRTMPNPADPEGKPLVGEKFYKDYLAAKGAHRATIAEGLLQKVNLGLKLADQSIQQKTAESQNRYRLQEGNAAMLRAGAGGSEGVPQTYTDDKGREWRLGAGGHWYPIKANVAPKPPDTKKLFGLTQAEFLDSSKTQRGNIVDDKFTPDDKGTHVQITSGSDEDKKVLMTEPEFNAHKEKIFGTPPTGAAAPSLTPRDQQAVAWARANPTDPRASQILQKLGL